MHSRAEWVKAWQCFKLKFSSIPFSLQKQSLDAHSTGSQSTRSSLTLTETEMEHDHDMSLHNPEDHPGKGSDII